MMDEDPDLKAKVSYASDRQQCYTGNEIAGGRFFPGWLFETEEPYIQQIREAMKTSGLCPQIKQYNFCTNGSHYAGEAGIKTIGLGPSTESVAHTIDEYIEVNQLYDAVESYYCVMKALLNPAE